MDLDLTTAPWEFLYGAEGDSTASDDNAKPGDAPAFDPQQLARRLDDLSRQIEEQKRQNESLRSENEAILRHKEALLSDLKNKGRDVSGSSSELVRELEELRREKEAKEKNAAEALAAKDRDYGEKLKQLEERQREQDQRLAEVQVMTPFQKELSNFVYDVNDAIRVTGITSKSLINIGGQVYARGEKTEEHPEGELFSVERWAKSTLNSYMLKDSLATAPGQQYKPSLRPMGSLELSPISPSGVETSRDPSANPFIRKEGVWNPWAQEQLASTDPAKAEVLRQQARQINSVKE